MEVGVILYHKASERPSRDELSALVGMLEDPVEDLVRKDATFRSLGLKADALVGDAAAVVELLDTHIELMQRPVLVKGKRAIIGRPKDRIGEFLK